MYSSSTTPLLSATVAFSANPAVVSASTDAPLSAVSNPIIDLICEELPVKRWVRAEKTDQIRKQLSTLNEVEMRQLCKRVASLGEERIASFVTIIPTNLLFTGLNKRTKKWNRDEFFEMLKYLAQSTQPIVSTSRVSATTSKPNTLDILLLATSYVSADHEPSGPWEAIQMLQAYVFIILFPFVFAPYIENFLQPIVKCNQLDILGAQIAIMITACVALKIYKSMRPIPNEFKPMSNFTKEALTNHVQPLLERDDVIEKIFMCWQSTNASTRQHPLLIGPPGVGKTVIFIEIARKIALGQIPEALKSLLKGKKMFGGPAALLLPSSPMDGDNKMELFLRSIEPYKENIILALDELAVLMNEASGIRNGEFFKSVLDTSSRGLPYFIATMTDHEYKMYIESDPAKKRRFNPIKVSPLNEDQVKLTLHAMVLQQYPSTSLSDSFLNHLYQATSKRIKQAQPEISKKILMLAFSKVFLKEQQCTSASMLIRKNTELATLRMQVRYAAHNTNVTGALIAKAKSVETEINSLQKQVDHENSLIQDHKNLTRKITTLRDALGECAAKLYAQHQRNAVDESNLKWFLFHNYFVVPAMQKQKEQIAQKLQIPTLDETMIDELVEEYAESIKTQEQA